MANNEPDTGSWSEKHPDSVGGLLTSLRALKESNPKAVRATVHIYPASIYDPNQDGTEAGPSTDRRITSWKMTEHMYFQAKNPFPTMARGLFTEAVVDQELPPGVSLGDAQDRIVARGYDKFFNVDEVAWTNWDAMGKHTESPYHLTLKSNGCLILISALSPKHLMVASKHALGTITESELSEKEAHKAAKDLANLSFKEVDKKGKKPERPEESEQQEAKVHAEEGRRWLRKTLEKSERTEAELANELWTSNRTAVLELCDDSFEEHVIATPEYWTGLHLHGLNDNTPHFSTASPAAVADFARKYGFIPTKSVTLQTLEEVKNFTTKVADTGSWEGDMIEGFVVRSTVRDARGPGRPPYRPGAPFFFKVKFDEPYLLYRQWREVTRVLLPITIKSSEAEKDDIRKKTRAKATKTRRPEVAVYADWAIETIEKDAGLFANYDKGVVRVRERFLRWIEGDGKTKWEAAKAGKTAPKAERKLDREGLPKKWLLVPIAVPGCGKTLVGNALSHLFGFGHTQSDDVTAKKSAPTFLLNITKLLQTNEVVYADRNNHIEKHYSELSALADKKELKKFDLRLIAIMWDVEALPYHRALRVCSERVVKRGDNHQTLRPDPTIDAEHEVVVGSFLRNFTPPDPSVFDKIISIPIEDDPRRALQTILRGLEQPLGLDIPSESRIDEALAYARAYKTDTPYHPPSKLGKAVRYFGLAPEIDLEAVLSPLFKELPSSHADSAAALFEEMRKAGRITTKPHVTLCHEKNVEAEKEAGGPGALSNLWDQCKALAERPTPVLWKFNLTHLVWDDRVMALVIDHITPAASDADVALDLPGELKTDLHVTVGTRNSEISAFESRGIVRVARAEIGKGRAEGEVDEQVEGGGKVRWAKIGPIKGEGRIKGMS